MAMQSSASASDPIKVRSMNIDCSHATGRFELDLHLHQSPARESRGPRQARDCSGPLQAKVGICIGGTVIKDHKC